MGFFAQIDPEAVFGTNTSSLPITSLALRSCRPENYVGVHFFSPVHRMRLVELIRGRETSDRTLAKVFDYVLKIGKTPIVVNDSRGFYTSRVFGTYLNEGAALLADINRHFDGTGWRFHPSHDGEWMLECPQAISCTTVLAAMAARSALLSRRVAAARERFLCCAKNWALPL